MADDDSGTDSPSLEPPSLGLGFWRRKKQSSEDEPSDGPPETVAVEAPDSAVRTDEAPPASAASPASPAPPAPAPARPSAPVVRQEERQQGRPLFADEAQPERVGAAAMTPPGPAAPPPAPGPEPAPTAVQPIASTDAEPGVTGESAATSWTERIPVFAGRQAAAVTGLLVGLLVVAITAGVMRGCEVVRGTSTCGGGPGFLLLVATMIVSIYAGALLLRLWGEPEPGSTSFLAVSLVAVASLLFFINVLLSWWMVVVVPLTSVGAFLLSHWVTTTYIDPREY